MYKIVLHKDMIGRRREQNVCDYFIVKDYSIKMLELA